MKKVTNSKAIPVTTLPAEQAMNFFLESNQYCTTELPEYFDFAPVLEYAKMAIGNKSLIDICNGANPSDISGVNLEVISNKDGRYGVRPLTLANPFLYYLKSATNSDAD